MKRSIHILIPLLMIFNTAVFAQANIDKYGEAEELLQGYLSSRLELKGVVVGIDEESVSTAFQPEETNGDKLIDEVFSISVAATEAAPWAEHIIITLHAAGQAVGSILIDATKVNELVKGSLSVGNFLESWELIGLELPSKKQLKLFIDLGDGIFLPYETTSTKMLVTADGVPVPNALVEFSVSHQERGGGGSAQVQTDDNGIAIWNERWIQDNLGPWEINATVSKDGYPPQTVTETFEVQQPHLLISFSLKSMFKVGEAMRSVINVFDEDNNAASGVEIRIVLTHKNTGISIDSTVNADENGSFVWEHTWLPSQKGPWSIQVQAIVDGEVHGAGDYSFVVE